MKTLKELWVIDLQHWLCLRRAILSIAQPAVWINLWRLSSKPRHSVVSW